MRLRTKKEIAEEFRIPTSGVDSRMAELGCLPTRHKPKGRGYHTLYDADEVARAILNERELAAAKKQRRHPVIKQAPDEFWTMGWSKAMPRSWVQSPSSPPIKTRGYGFLL